MRLRYAAVGDHMRALHSRATDSHVYPGRG